MGRRPHQRLQPPSASGTRRSAHDALLDAIRSARCHSGARTAQALATHTGAASARYQRRLIGLSRRPRRTATRRRTHSGGTPNPKNATTPGGLNTRSREIPFAGITTGARWLSCSGSHPCRSEPVHASAIAVGGVDADLLHLCPCGRSCLLWLSATAGLDAIEVVGDSAAHPCHIEAWQQLPTCPKTRPAGWLQDGRRLLAHPAPARTALSPEARRGRTDRSG